MFGIGFPEMILILALALIVVGPDKLPDLARSIAKTIMDLKKTAEGLKDNLNIEDNPLNEIRPELESAAKNFKETIIDSESHSWKDSSLPVTKDVNTLDLPSKEMPQPTQSKTVDENIEKTDSDVKKTSELSDDDQRTNTDDTK